MSLVLNTNVTSLIAQHRLDQNRQTLTKAMERLSSGQRINRSADDAAGLSLSQNLNSQIRRMQQASRNVQDGVSSLETADGAMSVITDNLQRIRELAVQAGNDTNDSASRSSLSNEIRMLMSDVERIANATQINGTFLLNGTATNAMLQIGANSDLTTNSLDLTPAFSSATPTGLGAVGGTQTFATTAAIDLSTGALARTFTNDLDAAIAKVNVQRSRIGAYQNQLDSVYSNLDSSIINSSASKSRIRDVDIASESAIMTQAQVLTQASTMVLSQTNELPKMILSLLQK